MSFNESLSAATEAKTVRYSAKVPMARHRWASTSTSTPQVSVHAPPLSALGSTLRGTRGAPPWVRRRGPRAAQPAGPRSPFWWGDSPPGARGPGTAGWRARSWPSAEGSPRLRCGPSRRRAAARGPGGGLQMGAQEHIYFSHTSCGFYLGIYMGQFELYVHSRSNFSRSE